MPRCFVRSDALISADQRQRITKLADAVYPPGLERAGASVHWAPPTIRALVSDESGSLTCHVGGLVRTVFLDHRPVTVGGIGGVMTAPPARRQGHARIA